MHWLQTLDVNLFHLVNLTGQNAFFDRLMPFASGNAYFFPVLAIAGFAIFWKGNARVRLMVLMLLVILPLGDTLVCNTLKQAIGRPRPPLTLTDVHQLLGIGFSKSMPSSHAANWAAATIIAFIYFRRTLWFMLPLAALVSYSRVYNGVHYPSDVLVGAIVGAGYGALGVWCLNQLWCSLGQKWFPLWWQKFPSLIPTSDSKTPTINYQLRVAPKPSEGGSTINHHWLRFGYLFLAVVLLARLAYIASGVIDLSEDETYYWLWSKHPALSYFSKPPLVAYTHWLGTHLFGDTAFGVRFFSPIIAAILGFIVLRFMAREVNARAAFILLVAVNAAPLLAVGGTLMTIDPLSVLFWTAATFAGWRAVQDNSTTRDWLWVGLWMGLGFLSKYTALFQLLCWATYFVIWPPARKQLRRPGPWLALLVNLLCALPVLIWNHQHGWITVAHVASDARVGEPWHFTLNFFTDFVFQEFALLNPVFFVAMIWAAIAFWRRQRRAALPVYFFAMGAPLFLVYLGWTFHSRVLPNWIAPSVLPLFCLATIYWNERWQSGAHGLKRWLQFGFALGLTAVVLLHDTDLIQQIAKRSLPPQTDPLGRVRSWNETATAVDTARKTLLTEGKEVFVIGGHYGITSQMAFRLQDGTTNVFCLPSDHPQNQFFFWPGYAARQGQNAIYVTVLGNPTRTPAQLLEEFLTGKFNTNPPVTLAPPPQLTAQFASVTDLGMQPILYRSRTLRWLQLFACRDLR
jgi:4-amino-4-deoxy-L-arabinose transferase-like glycosyltransferase/membrane-associated phospholipid phosphatase